jgi:hypothetical protein
MTILSEKILSARPSVLSKAILTLKGKPLDLDDYKPFEIIYDSCPASLTAMAGRQIGKSVSLAAAITTNSIARQYFTTLFVSPLSQQTSRFSTQYLEPFLHSRIVRKHFIDSSSKKNVFQRTFSNGSAVTLSYAETEQDADRARGIAGDALYCDEIQDMSLEALPVLAETLSASDYGFTRYTGTAKGESNSLTVMFKRSNMMEWVVKCPSCGYYNIPNDLENCLAILQTNPHGPGCIKCGTLLNMKTGAWVAGKPSETEHLGVHLPQIIIPARTAPKKWKQLLYKAKNYSSVKLANEVFGLPVGAGGRPLSLREAMACCNPDKTSFDTGFPRDSRNILVTVLGVDWSVTGSDKSYTVVSVLGYDYLGKCYLLHTKKLDGIDILEQVRIVEDTYARFQCSAIGSDRGVGVLQGQLMQQDLGTERVNMINYVAAKTQLRWDREGVFFAADRTMNMDTMLLKSKMGISKFETPSWNIMSEYWQDALNIFEEETQAGRRVFRKDADATDDWFHSIVFANIAYMIVQGQFSYVESDATENGLFTLPS